MISLSLHKHRMSYLLSRNHIEWIDCSISSIQQRDGQGKTLWIILIFSPISIVITLKGNEIHEIEQYRTALKPFPLITYQFFETNETHYPINTLRNIAINNTKTTHFFVCDMDFWLSCISLSSKLISSWIIWDHRYSTRLHNERWLARYYCSWIRIFEEERRMFFISELCWTVCLNSLGFIA